MAGKLVEKIPAGGQVLEIDLNATLSRRIHGQIKPDRGRMYPFVFMLSFSLHHRAGYCLPLHNTKPILAVIDIAGMKFSGCWNGYIYKA